MAPSHGPQHDVFRADSGTPHNGAQADSGYGHRGAEPHGGLTFDESFTAAAVNVAHGERWDDFGWHSMPMRHGSHFDSDFATPAALSGGEHGTWHDVFRGGTQIKAIVAGRDVEAVIIDTGADHARAVTRAGEHVEVGLGQITYFRSAQPDRPVRTAQAGDMGVVASEHAAPARGTQAAANGGQRTEKTSGSEELDVAKRGSAYGVTQGAGKMRVNVGPFCHGCAKTVKKALSGSSMATHPHVGTCRSCNAKVGKTAETDDVAKSVDATETATQRQDGVGHRSGCPRGGSAPCGPEQGGKCSACGAGVRDHQAFGKTSSLTQVIDVLKGLS